MNFDNVFIVMTAMLPLIVPSYIVLGIIFAVSFFCKFAYQFGVNFICNILLTFYSVLYYRFLKKDCPKKFQGKFIKRNVIVTRLFKFAGLENSESVFSEILRWEDLNLQRKQELSASIQNFFDDGSIIYHNRTVSLSAIIYPFKVVIFLPREITKITVSVLRFFDFSVQGNKLKSIAKKLNCIYWVYVLVVLIGIPLFAACLSQVYG